MLALIALLLITSALACVVLVHERRESATPPEVRPTFIAVAQGATVIVASQVACVTATTPDRAVAAAYDLPLG